MNWTQIFKEISIVTLIAGLITGAVTWLIKQLGQSIIDKNMRLYEQNLSNQSELFKQNLNQSFEEFKANLALMSEKANKLHDKRIERIEKIYSLLTDFYDDMFQLIAIKIVTGMSQEQIDKQDIENAQKASESGNLFLNYYSRNKLYFNPETCELIREISDLMKGVYGDLTMKYTFGRMPAQFEFETVKTASTKIRDKVPELKLKLEDNFRVIIGVN